MEPQLLTEAGFENDEDQRVREWQTTQLRRLGVPSLLAEAFAGDVDWHEVASLVRRGCPPPLAIDIVR
jgi:hypothetical protein